jgi:hypothetical protein
MLKLERSYARPPLPAALVRSAINVTCADRLPRFFFVSSRFSQKNFSKKAFPPRVILPGRGETHD